MSLISAYPDLGRPATTSDYMVVVDGSTAAGFAKVPFTANADHFLNGQGSLVAIQNETTFDNSDLTANVLTMTKGIFSIYDNTGALVSVDATRVSATQFTVDFGGAITGTWVLVN